MFQRSDGAASAPGRFPGRRVDLHGAHGHVSGQVLQEGDREGHDHPRGHPGQDHCGGESVAVVRADGPLLRTLSARSLSTRYFPEGFAPFLAPDLLFPPQIVKALEHLHNNLSVIHRGEEPDYYGMAEGMKGAFIQTLFGR